MPRLLWKSHYVDCAQAHLGDNLLNKWKTEPCIPPIYFGEVIL